MTILAAWRIGAVYQPLFTAFGPKAIEHRIQLAQSKLVVTDMGNRSKLDEIEKCPAIMTVLMLKVLRLKQVILISGVK